MRDDVFDGSTCARARLLSSSSSSSFLLLLSSLSSFSLSPPCSLSLSLSLRAALSLSSRTHPLNPHRRQRAKMSSSSALSSRPSLRRPLFVALYLSLTRSLCPALTLWSSLSRPRSSRPRSSLPRSLVLALSSSLFRPRSLVLVVPSFLRVPLRSFVFPFVLLVPLVPSALPLRRAVVAFPLTGAPS